MKLRQAFVRLALPFLLATLGAQPAAAGWTFGSESGTSAAIESLQDLPDNATFQRDGAHWDLGYVYEKSGGFGLFGGSEPQDGFFALYHGTDYVKLDAGGKARVIELIGFDPTAGYTPRAEGFQPTQAVAIATGETASSDDSKFRRKGFPMGWLGLVGLLFGLGTLGYRILFAARRATSGVAGLARTIVRAGSAADDEPSTTEQLGSDRHLSFDQRVAARLAELEQSRSGTGSHGAARDYSEDNGTLHSHHPPGEFGRKAN